MSLINNMLKDLEKREHTVSHKPYLAIDNPTSKRLIPWKNIIIFTSVITILFCTAAFFLLHKKSPASHVVSLLPPTQQQQVTTIASTSDAHWVKPVTISGVTLQTKDNITELTLLLNHPALYRLISDDMLNQVSLIVDHADLRAELPANTTSSSIQHITSENINGDAVFKLTLYPNASIKYVNLNSENKNPELVIAVENVAEKQDPVNTSTKLSKTPALRDVLNKQYQQALSSASNGHYQIAITDLSNILKMDPEYSDARVSLIAILMNQGSLNKARKYINEGLQLNPDHLPLIELKARLLASEGKNQEALALLEAASPPLIDNPEYYGFIAALYERNNNDSLAAQVYRKLLSINNHNGSWWFGLGVSLDKLGKTQEAAEAYTTAATEGQLDASSLAYLQKRLSTLQGMNDDKG